MIKILCLAMIFAACLTQGLGLRAESRQPHGKTQAPVTATAQFGEKAGTVTLRFEGDAQGVQIGIRGLGGLVLDQISKLPRSDFKRGECIALTLAFTPGPGGGQVVVNVVGVFDGRKQVRVQTFSLGRSGEEPMAQKRNIIVTSEGQVIQVQPAQSR